MVVVVVGVVGWEAIFSEIPPPKSRLLPRSLGRQSGGYLGSNFRAFIATFSFRLLAVLSADLFGHVICAP